MKNFTAIILAIAMIVTMAYATVALAEDRSLEAQVTRVEQRTDRNGVEYTMAIVKFKNVLNGTEYDKEIPLMFFGSKNDDKAKSLAVGDAINAIVNYRKLPDGRESFSLQAWK